METSLPVAERPRRPEWMKVRAPSADGRYFDVKKLIHGASLHTVCEEARCPNIAECWGKGTATFQILGDTCTRACRYCYVNSGRPEHAPDPLEPLRLAQAAAQMGLKHVVVTSVDRDDVDDRGAGHFAATIRALKAKLPGLLGRGADARLPRGRGAGARDRDRRAAGGVQPQHRDRPPPAPAHARRARRATTARSDLLRRAKEVADYPVLTKSGHHRRPRRDERRGRRDDARPPRATASTSSRSASTCSRRASTPTIDRWVHPDEFRWLREQGEALGFGSVFAGPLVRSSYRADEQKHAADTGLGVVAY